MIEFSGIVFFILIIAYTWRWAYKLNGSCDTIGEFFGVFLMFLMLVSVGLALLPLTIIFVAYDIIVGLKEKNEIIKLKAIF